LGELLAGGGADFLDPGAALAEHDRPLRGPPNEDLLVDRDGAVLALLIFSVSTALA
jgi:hypothetical protein